MIVNFDALCRDISALGPESTRSEIEHYAQSQRTFLEKVAEIICFNYRGLRFTVQDVQDSVRLDFAGLSSRDLMLISRCVKLMADKVVSKYAHCDALSSRYYKRQRVGRYVR